MLDQDKSGVVAPMQPVRVAVSLLSLWAAFIGGQRTQPWQEALRAVAEIAGAGCADRADWLGAELSRCRARAGEPSGPSPDPEPSPCPAPVERPCEACPLATCPPVEVTVAEPSGIATRPWLPAILQSGLWLVWSGVRHLYAQHAEADRLQQLRRRRTGGGYIE